jgi:diphthine synthase
MSPTVALEQILSLLPSEEAPSLKPAETLAITVSRVGSPTQRLLAGTLQELANLPEDAFGGPLHSMVIISKRLHPMERDFGLQFAVNKDSWLEGCKRYGCEG